MTFQPLIESNFTAIWPLWLMFFVMIIYAVAMIRRPQTLRAAWQMTFSSVNRVYNDTSFLWNSSMDLRAFCVLVFALSAQLLAYTGGPFRFTQYLLIFLGVEAWAWLRRGVRYMVEKHLKLKNKGFPPGLFIGLGVILCSVLLVANILYIVWDWHWVWLIIMGIVLLLWLGVIMTKLFHYFVRGWKSFLAVMAYWLVVEVGSLFGLYELIMVL